MKNWSMASLFTYTYLLLVRFHDAKKYIFLLNEFERNQIQKLVLHDHSIMLNKQFWKSVLYFSIYLRVKILLNQRNKIQNFPSFFESKICYLPMRTQYLHAYTQRMFCNFYFNFVRI